MTTVQPAALHAKKGMGRGGGGDSMSEEDKVGDGESGAGQGRRWTRLGLLAIEGILGEDMRGRVLMWCDFYTTV